MSFFSLFAILFGTVIILYPDFIAYIIGFLFVFIGINSLVYSLALKRKHNGSTQSWNVGNYEIIKKK